MRYTVLHLCRRPDSGLLSLRLHQGQDVHVCSDSWLLLFYYIVRLLMGDANSFDLGFLQNSALLLLGGAGVMALIIVLSVTASIQIVQKKEREGRTAMWEVIGFIALAIVAIVVRNILIKNSVNGTRNEICQRIAVSWYNWIGMFGFKTTGRASGSDEASADP